MSSAREEWAKNWPVPLISMLGYVGGASFAYSAGVFMPEVTGEFGWGRAQFMSAFTVHSIVAFALSFFIGPLVDRVGPRRMALLGIAPSVAGLSLFSLATGSASQWWLIGTAGAVLGSLLGGAVWIKAVVSNFTASRGLALALVLSGSGVATALWPPIAAWSIARYGWRASYPLMGIGWALLMLPLVFLFFKEGAAAVPTGKAPALVVPWKLYLSRTFISLAIAGALFSPLTLGVLLNLVAIFKDNGFSVGQAAGIASLAGLFAIAGRLCTGLLLDLLPTRLVAVATFLLPIPIALLLLLGGSSFAASLVAVAILGFVSGADGDVIAYVISRTFGVERFGSVYAVMVSILAISSSLGPMIAGLCFDRWGTYDPYFYGMIWVALLAAGLVGTLPLSGLRVASWGAGEEVA